jgi:hypothetical protein
MMRSEKALQAAAYNGMLLRRSRFLAAAGRQS